MTAVSFILPTINGGAFKMVHTEILDCLPDRLDLI
jgi:hypothetical protein